MTNRKSELLGFIEGWMRELKDSNLGGNKIKSKELENFYNNVSDELKEYKTNRKKDLSIFLTFIDMELEKIKKEKLRKKLEENSKYKTFKFKLSNYFKNLKKVVKQNNEGKEIKKLDNPEAKEHIARLIANAKKNSEGLDNKMNKLGVSARRVLEGPSPSPFS